MAGTWGDVIRDALIEIGVKEAGEALSADEKADSFRRLLGMFDEWGLEGLMIPGLQMINHTFTDSGFAFTIGPEDATNPPDIETTYTIEEISALNYRRSGQQRSMPIDPTSYAVLSEVRRTYRYGPRTYYYEQSYPVARLHFDAQTAPDDAMEIAGRGHFSSAIGIDEDPSLILPKGYREAVLLNLAVKLAPSYGVKDGKSSGLSSTTKSAARSGKMMIKNRNLQVLEARIDPALISHSSSQLRRYSSR